jgi:dienelactone hydrolase
MPVETTEIRDRGIVGVLATPTGSDPLPGVLLLGGSEGGLHARDAEVLAAEGFTVLALGYFGMPGLPRGLVEIPLEYVTRALDWLGARSRDPERLGVAGGSRGGELALLVAAHDTRVRAAVSVVGSGVLTPGIDFGRGTLLDILRDAPPSWTIGGAALPFLDHVFPEELRTRVATRRPVRLALAFAPPPTDLVELDRVSIRVEDINGAVLLISASDDGGWPSTSYSEVAADRLASARHPFPYEHRVLDSGHLIAGPPGAPMNSTTAPGPGVTFEMGGTPDANTAARAEAWRLTVDWFREHLQP